MNKIFNFEGPVFSFLSRLADLFWLNLLFIVCCIPVITAGKPEVLEKSRLSTSTYPIRRYMKPEWME